MLLDFCCRRQRIFYLLLETRQESESCEIMTRLTWFLSVCCVFCFMKGGLGHDMFVVSCRFLLDLYERMTLLVFWKLFGHPGWVSGPLPSYDVIFDGMIWSLVNLITKYNNLAPPPTTLCFDLSSPTPPSPVTSLQVSDSVLSLLINNNDGQKVHCHRVFVYLWHIFFFKRNCFLAVISAW